MRVFLDTNVLVSAFATRGLCADLFRHILAEHELVIGDVVLDELTRVLATRFEMPAAAIAEITTFLRQYPSVPRPAEPSPLPVTDVDDGWVLASAVDGEADVLVTGDKDLLSVADQAPVRILDPRGFWTLVRTDPSAGN